MIGIGIANSLGVNLSGINPATKSFMSATGISNPNEVKAINDLVTGLQADGIWPKMKALYPFVTDNRNLFDYTEDFSNAYWIKPNATVTNNSVIAPNGTLTADTIAFGPSGTVQKTLLSNGNMTFSIYAKYISTQWLFIENYNNADLGAWFDIQNGVIGTIASGVTANIENAGNGWFRCSVTMLTTNASNSIYAAFNTTTNGNYTRTGSAYFWGAQLELGSTATTYQPIATTQQAYISNQFKFNLVNPVDSDAAFRLVFNGGWTHSANGATPNGTNGYADTFLIPSAQLTTTSGHLSTYSRSNTNVGFDMGADFQINAVISRFNNLFYANYGSYDANVANTDSRGHFITNRNSATKTTGFKNGSKVIDFTVSANLSSFQIAIGGLRNSSSSVVQYSNKQTAFASIGNGLTDTEAANLYTRVQAFQTALNRQV